MDLSKYTNKQLGKFCKELNRKSSGSKQELMLRLLETGEDVLSATIAKVMSENNENLLDLTVEEGSEDEIAKLKGEVATLNATVEALVQSIKLLIPGTNGSPATSSAVDARLQVTGEVGAKETQGPLGNVCEGSSVERVGVSDVVCTHQEDHVNANAAVAQLSTTNVVSNANAAAENPLTANVVTQRPQFRVAHARNCNDVNYESHGHGTCEVLVNDGGETVHTDVAGSQYLLQNARSVHHSNAYGAEHRQGGGVFATDSAPHYGRADTASSMTMRSNMDVREMSKILPEYNPGRGLSSVMFIERINQLRRVYNWSDDMLLFAIYDQLKGPAKMWLNSMPIFRKWNDFVHEFLIDFPSEINTAELNIKMMRSRMHREESYADYYYRMLAMGRSGEMADAAIVTYIINGLNDDAAKKFLSAMFFPRCSDLLRALSKLQADERKPYTMVRQPIPPMTMPMKSQNNSNVHKQQGKSESVGPVCFRCRNRGHIARNCPKRSATDRVNVVQEADAAATDVVINKIVQDNKPLELKKIVIIKGKIDLQCEALIDTGSARSLIKKSVAESCGVTKIGCNERLAGFAGGLVQCEEKLLVNIQLDNLMYSAELLIVTDNQMPCDVLLGIDVLAETTMVINRGVCHVLPIRLEHADVGDELSDESRNSIRETLQKFSNCFGDNIDELGVAKNYKMQITLSSNVPVSLKPYPVPIPKQQVVERITSQLLEKGIIQKSQSNYSSPIVLVKKANGEDRLCIDYRKLNSITEKQPWQMPTVDGVLATLSGKGFFTTLDMMMGYYQLQMEENSKQYTAFVTHHGHFEFNRMPFGLRNAPSAFQKMMTALIEPLRKVVTCYVDEIIIATKTANENIEILNKFLALVEEEGLTLRLSKCEFLKRSVAFLGHVVDEHGIRPGEEKTQAITSYSVPCSQMDVRRFLGLAGYFRKFVPRFGIIAKPLTNLLKKDEKFVWTKECEEAFQKLKMMLTKPPVLVVYDASKEHQLHTDASSVGLAAILLQNEDGVMKPVSYFSRTCNTAEKNYHAYELETLAVVQACDRFRTFLLGKHFTIVTDCQSISTAKLNKPMVPRIARWFLKLLEFDFELIHRPGERMQHVDAMSRAPGIAEGESTDVSGKIMSIDAEDWVSSLQGQDSNLKSIMNVLAGIEDSHQKKQLVAEYQLINRRLFKRLGEGKKLLVVPKGLRWRIAKLCHDDMGHPGVDGSIKRVLENFWFPRVRNFMKGYIKSCVDCSYHREPRIKQSELFGMEVPKIPFEVLHMDHLGPFVKSRRGNEYVLVIVDALSRYAIITPTKTTKTKPVLDAINQLTLYFGLPQKIITDRGTAFTSNQFAEYCRDQNIQHIKVAVRTPRANGLAERINQEVLKFLKPSVDDERDWDTKLRQLQWMLNTKKNTTTKMTAMDLIFDFPLRDLNGNKLLNALHDDTFVTMNNRREEAVKNINKARESWKRRFDDKHQHPKKYQEGDLVLLQSPTPSTGQSRKLQPTYRGPYKVSKVLRFDRYVIENVEWLKDSHRKFSTVAASDKMKPWCALVPEIDEDYEDDDQTDVDTKISDKP